MSLTEDLANKKAINKQKIPSEIWAIMDKSTNALKESSLSSKTLKKGAQLLDFSLPNSKGKQVALQDFTANFLVISFYRGGWCPYCNLELRALQGILPELKDLNTDLIAISPETPDNSLTTSEKNELQFSVLSDIDNLYAKSLGLVFKLPEDLIKIYHSFNLKVDQYNNNLDYELPMPATFIVNKNREILYSFAPEDYTERLDPKKIIAVLTEASA